MDKRNYSELWYELRRWVDGGLGVLADMIGDPKYSDKVKVLQVKYDVLEEVFNKMEEMHDQEV